MRAAGTYHRVGERSILVRPRRLVLCARRVETRVTCTLGDPRTHEWRDLRPEQLDRPHRRAMRHAGEVDQVARVAEDVVLEEDLLRDGLRIADEQRAARTAQ